jgi:hypothetical protein
MNERASRSWIGQVVLFFVLSLLFSAFPFASAMVLNKSSVTLTIITAWYAGIPPLVVLVIAWLLYRREKSWLKFVGRLWVAIGLWFGVQALLTALSEAHIFVRLFALPATLAGGKGYVTGAALFLIGGLILWIAGKRFGLPRSENRNRGVFGAATGLLLVLVVVGFPLLIAFTSRPAPSIPAAGPELPTSDEVFGYVSDVYQFGIRRPGWPAYYEAKEYLIDKLESFGFEEIHTEPHRFDLWMESEWSLTIDPDGDAWQPETYFVPYSGPTDSDGVTGEVVYVGEGTEEDLAATNVSGKIALVDLAPVAISWDEMKIFSYMAYDPDGTAAGWDHPYPIGWLPQVERVNEMAEERGAKGMIGVLRGYPEMGDFGYYAPYDGHLRPLPGIYVLEGDGDRLIGQVESEPVQARLVLNADVSMDGGEAWTIYGVLPGGSDKIVMVHTHFDAPWRSGIEDSSGIGMVLGLARYYAELPESARDHTMVFIFMGSHMVGGPSNHAFMETHANDIMADLVLDVCLEHIADDYLPPNSPAGLVEPRGNFMNENPIAVSLYAGAVADHNAYRMLIFPTGTPLSVPTDAGMFVMSGYPVSSLISGPVWLFDDDDTLERVHKEQLGVLSAMNVDFIQRLGRIPDPLLSFDLNVWTIIVTAILLTPLATLSAAFWPRKPNE